MFTVYVRFFPTHNKIYFGYTSDINARCLSHNELAGKGFTVKFRPWTILHTEEFPTKAEAMKREKQLKSVKAREWIWNFVRNSSH